MFFEIVRPYCLDCLALPADSPKLEKHTRRLFFL